MVVGEMTTNMIKIDDLDGTMVVAQQVVDRSGVVLLGKGQVIQSNYLEVLRSAGVFEVPIESSIPTTGGADAAPPVHHENLSRRFALNGLSQSPIPVLIKICQDESAAGHAPAS